MDGLKKTGVHPRPVGSLIRWVSVLVFRWIVALSALHPSREHRRLRVCVGGSAGGQWGHSTGMVVWNEAGEGRVLQVTSPSWPGAGNRAHPRKNSDNTLGCVLNNNVKFSQHFFALSLTHEDLVDVLSALSNASVVTDPSTLQIVSTGGPDDVRALVAVLGEKSDSTTPTIK